MQGRAKGAACGASFFLILKASGAFDVVAPSSGFEREAFVEAWLWRVAKKDCCHQKNEEEEIWWPEKWLPPKVGIVAISSDEQNVSGSTK